MANIGIFLFTDKIWLIAYYYVIISFGIPTFDLMFKIILWIIILTFLFRFVFRFLLPILQITGAAQQRVRDMQKQMEDMQQKSNNASKGPAKPKSVDGDYIEYEEVK